MENENKTYVFPKGDIPGMTGLLAGLTMGFSQQDENLYDELIKALNLVKEYKFTAADFVLCLCDPTFNKPLLEKIEDYKANKEDIIKQIENMSESDLQKLKDAALEITQNKIN